MVPTPRRLVEVPRRFFLHNRWAALVTGVAAGIGALVAATYYVSISLYETVLIPLGVGGTVYYNVHYEVSFWDTDAVLRRFLTYWALLLVAMWTAPSAGDANAFVGYLTVVAVGFFVMTAAAVDETSGSNDSGDDRLGTGDGSRERNHDPTTAD